ncbi:MAG: SpoIIE family protein phosphatase [Clostridia bacterium]
MLVGGGAGITIGVVLGIISDGEPIMVASYAIAGMLAGLFNKFGKIGVIVGFILGNVLLTYVANGNVVPIILFREILIASIALLAIPKNVGIEIEDLFGKEKLLPETTGRSLEENKETIYKLNNISETISEMAKSYKEAAATIVDDEELEKQEEYNKNIFVNELKNSLDGLEENIIYDDIYNDEDIQKDIYKCLLEKEMITKKDLLNIFALHNNYIVGSNIDDNNKSLEKDLSRIIKSINYAYRISNLNFIWKKKVDESKKNVSTQLEGVSEAISNLAEEISPRQVEKFVAEKEKIKIFLKQKEIDIKDISIKQEETGRYSVTLYTGVCENVDGTQCNIKKIAQILSKVLNSDMVLQKQECGLRLNKENCMYTYISKDKYGLQVGIAKSTKKGSPVSGDTSIQTKLDDGKYLLALSDGMGSGPEARKSSKIAIKMLERLLTSGFEKDTSIKLINSTLSANTEEDMYATLDIQILDLYSGNIEFIKNGACPTYIKRDNEVQILKSESLPTGILEDIDLEVYDKDLEDGDIIVMCSDGILDSNTEYLNKELWVKYLLEDIQTDDVQKIADIIVNEARDNDYGSEKDDMTVIVAKVKKRK